MIEELITSILSEYIVEPKNLVKVLGITSSDNEVQQSKQASAVFSCGQEILVNKEHSWKHPVPKSVADFKEISVREEHFLKVQLGTTVK